MPLSLIPKPFIFSSVYLLPLISTSPLNATSAFISPLYFSFNRRVMAWWNNMALARLEVTTMALACPFHLLGRVLHEVVYHHIGFVVDDVWVLVHILHHQTECVLLFVFRCVFQEGSILLTSSNMVLEGGIVFQHVKDKAFLDGLFHGIGVECLSVTASRVQKSVTLVWL